MTEAIIGVICAAIGSLATWFVAKANRKDKYKLAIYSERIAKHQEAYVLSWALSKSLGQADIMDTQNKCHDWWIHNRLYLTNEAAKAFREAYQEAHFFHKEGEGGSVKGQKEENKKVLRLIGEADKAIAQGIGLEYLGGLKKKDLSRKKLR